MFSHMVIYNYQKENGHEGENEMQIGDKVSERIVALGVMQQGEIVYIHPERRFYVVEFRFLFGSFRESYMFPIQANGKR